MIGINLLASVFLIRSRAKHRCSTLITHFQDIASLRPVIRRSAISQTCEKSIPFSGKLRAEKEAPAGVFPAGANLGQLCYVVAGCLRTGISIPPCAFVSAGGQSVRVGDGLTCFGGAIGIIAPFPVLVFG